MPAMENMQDILRNYRFTSFDEKNLPKLAEILIPASDRLAGDFYGFLMENPHTAAYFRSDAATVKRKETIKSWFREILTSRYDHHLLMRLQRIGAVHVKIGLKGHYVNSAMNFIRRLSHRMVFTQGSTSLICLTLEPMFMYFHRKRGKM